MKPKMNIYGVQFHDGEHSRYIVKYFIDKTDAEREAAWLNTNVQDTLYLISAEGPYGHSSKLFCLGRDNRIHKIDEHTFQGLLDLDDKQIQDFKEGGFYNHGTTPWEAFQQYRCDNIEEFGYTATEVPVY